MVVNSKSPCFIVNMVEVELKHSQKNKTKEKKNKRKLKMKSNDLKKSAYIRKNERSRLAKWKRTNFACSRRFFLPFDYVFRLNEKYPWPNTNHRIYGAYRKCLDFLWNVTISKSLLLAKCGISRPFFIVLLVEWRERERIEIIVCSWQ